MKMHRSIQLFLYYSGGECSDTVFVTTLEREAWKEQQSDVVRFLVAEGAATRHKIKTPWNAQRGNHTFA